MNNWTSDADPRLSYNEKVRKRSSLRYLREQFIPIKSIYEGYIQRLNHGYFSLFLILQFCLSASYVLLIYFENKSKPLEYIVPDLVLYGVTAIISFVALFLLSEKLVKKNTKRNVLFYSSLAALLLIYTIDTSLPIYHYVARDEIYRTPFTTHLIIACYIFFSISSFGFAFLAGVFVTVSHLIVSGAITHAKDSTDEIVRRLIIELIYLGCVNALGAYFRYMNEIMYRRNFLDSKDVTNMKVKVDQETKQRENLLSSIIPAHITEEILKDKKIQGFLGKPETGISQHDAYSFKKTFLFEHKNVTIVYADIVNYTEMTSRTKASDLVEVLNDLFGSFDNDSEQLNVVRIKFLGDCYYGVSGLETNPNPNHADSCVQLGLRMIKTINMVNVNRKVNLNMRIGIHTGDIYAGIIGLTKWQMEIWSQAVFIANKMESSGFPGKVHITQQTKDQLKQSYNMIQTNATEFDDFLKSCKLTTYVISPNPMEESFIDVSLEKTTSKLPKHYKLGKVSRVSGDQNKASMALARQLSDMDENKVVTTPRKSYQGRRSGNVGEGMILFQDLDKSTQKTIQDEVDKMPLSKYAQWVQERDINPALLIFYKWKQELSYLLLPDHLFRFYIASTAFVLICFIAIRFIALPRWEHTALLSIITLIVLMALAPILWLTEDAPNNEDIDEEFGNEFFPPHEERTKSAIPKAFYTISSKFVDKVLLRIAIYVLLCSILTACIVIELTHCDYDLVAFGYDDLTEEAAKCIEPWVITEAIGLSLITSFVFLKIHLWLKFTHGALVTIGYSYWIWNHAYDYFDVETFSSVLRPAIAHIVCIVYLTFTLHLIDRQADYMYRLSHKWNQALIVATKEAEELRESNQRLLANVMPLNVAEKYYKRSQNDTEKKHYCESYPSVAVMFATVVNIDEDHKKDDKLMLTLMNEIISDFDRVLCKEKYKNKVEKIKLANWTYVACAGLTPGKVKEEQLTTIREEPEEEDPQLGTRSKDKSESDANMLILLEFAVDIRKALIRHNADCNGDYKLRIGLCDGPLTAGVVGTKKPHYDIWGDCVNMASRMDTTGTPGSIQIWESTEMVLRRNGIACDYNQFIYVKGKSDIPTFNVKLSESNDLVVLEEESDDDDDF